MATKYYMAHNANRSIGGEQFEIVDIVSGTAVGVFESSDDKQQALLDAEVAKRRGVTVVGQKEYDSMRKKKAISFTNSPHSNQVGAMASLKSPAGVVVESGAKVEEADQTLESVEGALSNLGTVEKPTEPAE